MTTDEGTSEVNRKALTAFAFFAFLCTAGILTLFSQASFQAEQAHGSAAAQQTSLNPGSENAAELGEILPATLERGASLLETVEDDSEQGEPILRLR